jgi:sarcosine oxidase subunit gamma
MSESFTWAPRGAWAGIVPSGPFGAPGAAGVRVEPREGLGIASLIVAEGFEAALAEACKARFGLDLPMTPLTITSATHALAWTGPGQWLLIAEDRAGLRSDLGALAGRAAITEQSDGRASLRLSGPRVREALAKGCMIDLHPAAFPAGSAALTSIAHIGVHLWRIADGPDGAVFEIMAPRSMAGSFWSWFSASAAEFGCQVSGAKDPITGRG